VSHGGDAGVSSSTGVDTLLLDRAAGAGGPCPLCARPRSADDARGVAWSSRHGFDGTVTWICGRCTRAELWRVESTLPVTASSPGRRAYATERNAG
jgi:hypothetical protein